eukprot:CAMPEP_0172499724 /NCGR_PEP_ID=MMETSP1066-20121228/130008_1 /TAXON_ID=671091 /ORGANISM="Coscinodiscus wailesii, Strain CCMP2513" /LENGTH=445 /DNA_ID=CAMNT_0013273621 /DNA_START=64 /DNA_END=1401 /DNA_ORIENTATION=-
MTHRASLAFLTILGLITAILLFIYVTITSFAVRAKDSHRRLSNVFETNQTQIWTPPDIKWVPLGSEMYGEEVGDTSGHTVAMSSDGSTIAVGARWNNGTGVTSGHVRVYKLNETDWVPLGSDIEGEASMDSSGWSIAMSSDGNTLVVGAPYNNGNAELSGHVRVYRFNGTDWAQIGADIDGEELGDRSGWSVAMSSDGNTVAVGAPRNNGNGTNSGHARVYRFNDTGWAQIGSDINGEAPGDRSGESIAMSSNGNMVAIGASSNGGNGIWSGHVRVYMFNGTAWAQLGSDIDGRESWDQFGESVAMSSDGNILAIGTSLNSRSGHVRIYSFSGTDWTQVGSAIGGEELSDFSGGAVAMSSNGTTLIIGTPWNSGNGFESGQVRIYRFYETDWAEVRPALDGAASGDWFGYSVAMSSDGCIVAVGAPHKKDNGLWSGSVKVYKLQS